MSLISQIISNSNLNWIKADTLPICHNTEDRSKDVIMLYGDGFIARGYYDFIERCWFGYNTFLESEKYLNEPDYYIELW